MIDYKNRPAVATINVDRVILLVCLMGALPILLINAYFGI
jgi:hypothetical protein